MLQTWTVDAHASCALPSAAVSALLDNDADVAPAATMLAFLNQVVAVDHLTLLRYTGSCGAPAAPQLLEGVARRAAAQRVPGECFDQYRHHFWRCDEATRVAGHLAREAAPLAAVTALHMRRPDVPLLAWRREIYERAALVDRFSLLYALGRQQIYAVNLYRDLAVGAFRGAELERLLGLAPLLRSLHRRALRPAAARDFEAAAQRLARRVPALSPRELQVCARIAHGVSADGIAAELGIAPSTVDTLRKRAYAKLAQARVAPGRLPLARLLG